MRIHFLPIVLLLLFQFTATCKAGQQAAPLPQSAEAMKIVVESVSGLVQYSRNADFNRLMRDSVLTHGDKIVAGVGAVCKLEFQHPASGAVLSAVILRGYTELTVTEAYLQGEQSRTQLDVRQGVIRAGVVRTAVPPSYRVRTPRVVVGVRGTEIAEIEVSDDLGDRIRMGRVGTAMSHDVVPWFRSTRAGQGSQKPLDVDEGWRGGRLLRAIENAMLDSRVLLTCPHRRGGEVDFDRRNFDLVEFPGDYMSGANPGWERIVNGSKFLGRGCANCGP